MPRNYWMLVTTPENFEITKRLGFTQQGLKGGQRRKMQRMEVGDLLLYYVTGRRIFAAMVTLISKLYEDHTPLWKPEGGEHLNFRVKIKADYVLEEQEYIQAALIAPRLECVRRWIPEDWYMAFLAEDLHLIPKVDFYLIEGEMERIVKRRQGTPSVTR